MPVEKVSRVPSGRTRKIDTGSLLAARAAEGHVKIARLIEHRAVHLMEAGRERRPDLHKGGFAGDPVDPQRRRTALDDAGRDEHVDAVGRGVDDARRDFADPDLGRLTVFGQQARCRQC